MRGLDFHDCDSNKKVPKTSRSEDSEWIYLTSEVHYHCSHCGAYQYADYHSQTKIPKR